MAYNWFEWNGRRCTELGMYVLEQPVPTVPNERVTFTDVPGRPGSLATLEGEDVFEDITLTAECLVSDPTKILAIAEWLRGSGRVTFANREGGFYYARIVNQIPFEKVLRGNPHRHFSVNFRCKPFWYRNTEEAIVITVPSSIVTNPGSVYSEPVITLYGSGDITLIVNDTFVELNEISEQITLNSEIQEAYTGETLLNEHMEGEFPKLHPGNNLISWNGNVERMVISPNWRYLI